MISYKYFKEINLVNMQIEQGIKDPVLYNKNGEFLLEMSYYKDAFYCFYISKYLDPGNQVYENNISKALENFEQSEIESELNKFEEIRKTFE